MENILRVRKSIIRIAPDEILDTYTADEIDPITGFFINYLSSRGTANVVKASLNTVSLKTMSKLLKSLLGKDFTVTQGAYIMESGGVTDVSLWKINDSITYWGYWAHHAKQVKPKTKEAAIRIIMASAKSNFQIMADEAFGRAYTPGKAQDLFLQNQQLKEEKAMHHHNAESWRYLYEEQKQKQEQNEELLQDLSFGMAEDDLLAAENAQLRRKLWDLGIDPDSMIG
ncbi:hypothetical protein [Moorena sp. SIO3B2]|uniref:hypothetical protein n=1 Tax=Moorena sp. SIO3B2 TaxID=2607827 RepID=UPI0013C6C1CB|nr:hypothetical protein [Moorena sp. SIO3B2]NEP31742.1 hypothetical protein [Moorena sp. SIO3B2]NEP31767.1 hypothetical protein [Moorena sp. SIO3B2]